MEFSERLGWLILGLVVGFVLGYIVRSLREIKEELDEVDELVKNLGDDESFLKKPRNESGFARLPELKNIALMVVVLLAFWASFASQKASNETDMTLRNDQRQDARLELLTICNQEFLAKTIEALNERTEYTQASANANVKLQKAQAEFLNVVLIIPPVSDLGRREALNLYFNGLTHFVEVSERQKTKVAQNPYPTTEDLNACLNAVPEVNEEN